VPKEHNGHNSDPSPQRDIDDDRTIPIRAVQSHTGHPHPAQIKDTIE